MGKVGISIMNSWPVSCLGQALVRAAIDPSVDFTAIFQREEILYYMVVPQSMRTPLKILLEWG